LSGGKEKASGPKFAPPGSIDVGRLFGAHQFYREDSMSNSMYPQNTMSYPGGIAATIAADAAVVERMAFIRKTYAHLAAALALFAVLETILLTTFAPAVEAFILSIQGWGWLVVLGAFVAVSWVADAWARSGSSRALQYAGLGLYTVAEAIIFLPLLYIAGRFFPGSIESAAIVTGVIFGGLTLTVFVTRWDFSFLRMGLTVAGLAAFALLIVIVVLQLNFLAAAFSAGIIVLAAGYVLYYTSNVLHHYHTDQYVAAALALFASVALMFWYVLQLIMSLQRD
jgi:FtsH-binding integral membrane protein